jgi:hypothetical protein
MSTTNKNRKQNELTGSDVASEAGSPRMSSNLLDNRHENDDEHASKTYSFTSDTGMHQNEEETF